MCYNFFLKQLYVCEWVITRLIVVLTNPWHIYASCGYLIKNKLSIWKWLLTISSGLHVNVSILNNWVKDCVIVISFSHVSRSFLVSSQKHFSRTCGKLHAQFLSLSHLVLTHWWLYIYSPYWLWLLYITSIYARFLFFLINMEANPFFQRESI